MYLARRMAARQRAALFAVAFAVLGGSALVAAAGVLVESGLHSHLPVDRLERAGVVVSADQTFHPDGDISIALPERATVPVDVVARLARLPGVQAAVGDVSFPAVLVDPGGGVISAGDPASAGHAWSSTVLADDAGIDGSAPGPGEVVLGAATAGAAQVRPGDRVDIATGGRTSSYRVAGVAAAAQAGVLFDDRTAALLHSAGRVDLVGLRAAPGATGALAASVRAELDDSGLLVTTGAARGDVSSPGAAAARSSLVVLAGSLAGVVVLVIGFVVAAAMAVSVAAQRQELALLRTVGATPRQVRRLVASEAGVAAAAGLVPGLVLGFLSAEGLRRWLAELGVLPAELPLTLSPLPALATVLLLGVTVWTSASGAAWRVSRSPVTTAVAESRAELRAPSLLRARVGVLFLAAATTLAAGPLFVRSPIGATTTPVSGMLAVLGLGLAGPVLLHRAGDLLARSRRTARSAPTWLAAAGLRGDPRRASGVVTALAFTLVFVLTYAFTQTTLAAAASRDVAAGTLAQQSIGAAALGGLPDDVAATVRGTAGVVSAVPVSDTTVLVSQRTLGETDVTPHPALVLAPDAASVLDLDVTAGSLADVRGDAVAVGQDVSARPGARVDLVLGDGTRARARVVAVYARSLGFGAVVLSRDLAAGHTSTGLDQRLLVRTDGTPDAQQALARLVAARPGLTLDRDASTTRAMPPDVQINLAVIAVLLGYLLIAVVIRLVATVHQRRDELALLRMLGMTRRQVRAMMDREAALVGVLAIIGGVLLSAVPLALLGSGFLSRPWPAGPGWLPPIVMAAVLTITITTVATATRVSLRAATSVSA